jgi:hypothetical protein
MADRSTGTRVAGPGAVVAGQRELGRLNDWRRALERAAERLVE